MDQVMPEGEDLRRAVKWISNNREDDEDIPLQKLIEEAVFKFDLSPVDEEFLIGFFKKK
jgi:hypothetical protein